MASIVQFSWTRMDGIGLIAFALGISLLVQIPIIYYLLALLGLSFDSFYVAITGTITASTIILATIICSLAQDWWDSPGSTPPNLQRIIIMAFVILAVYTVGFFLFFMVEPIFPPEFSELNASSQFLLALLLSLGLVAGFTFLLYKIKNFINPV